MPSPSGRGPARQQFEALALPHLDALYNFALRMTRNEYDAEDLVQETCLQAYRRFAQLKDVDRCRQWLFRILRNTFINRWHKRKREPESIAYEQEMVGLVGPETPEEVVFGRLLDDELKAALERLPEEYRIAVFLSDLEGLAYGEIAEVLRCPIGTVRSRLSRGRRLLARQLQTVARERGYLKERRHDES